MSLGVAWEDRRAALIRESGNLASGGVPFFGARDAGRSPMSFSRLRRLAAACRFVSIASIALLVLVATPSFSRAADNVVSGVVVDQSGRGIPRAYVRVLDGSGVAAVMFADETGRFQVTVAKADSCRIEATLIGFQPKIVPCANQP